MRAFQIVTFIVSLIGSSAAIGAEPERKPAMGVPLKLETIQKNEQREADRLAKADAAMHNKPDPTGKPEKPAPAEKPAKPEKPSKEK